MWNKKALLKALLELKAIKLLFCNLICLKEFSEKIKNEVSTGGKKRSSAEPVTSLFFQSGLVLHHLICCINTLCTITYHNFQPSNNQSNIDLTHFTLFYPINHSVSISWSHWSILFAINQSARLLGWEMNIVKLVIDL